MNNIRDIITASPEFSQFKQSTGQFLNPLIELPPEEDKFLEHWTGKVVDNADPLFLGRVKVRILGHYEDFEECDLPWCVQELPPAGSLHANLVIPDVGALVRGYFDNGDEMKPIYTAMAYNVDKIAPAKVLNSVEFMADYPNIMTLFNTEAGDLITMNKADRNNFNVSPFWFNYYCCCRPVQ